MYQGNLKDKYVAIKKLKGRGKDIKKLVENEVNTMLGINVENGP